MARAAPPSPRSLVLREMAVIDVPAVGGIDARAFGPGGWPERAFRAELRENRLARYFVVADANSDALLGYVGCWLLADAVHLVTIGVDPVYQRQGIGELLVLLGAVTSRESRSCSAPRTGRSPRTRCTKGRTARAGPVAARSRGGRIGAW